MFKLLILLISTNASHHAQLLKFATGDVQKNVNVIGLVESEYLIAKVGFDLAENELLKVRFFFKRRDFVFTDPPCPSLC
jgi:hypothetical protein